MPKLTAGLQEEMSQFSWEAFRGLWAGHLISLDSSSECFEQAETITIWEGSNKTTLVQSWGNFRSEGLWEPKQNSVKKIGRWPFAAGK